MRKLIICLLLLAISCTSAGKMNQVSEQNKKSNETISKWTKKSKEIKVECEPGKIKYCLISGKIVNGRKEPSIKSKVDNKFREGELVFYISKSETQDTINGDTDYWYYVEKQDGNTSWVFGKFIIVLDTKNFDFCIYEKIMKEEIRPRRWSEKNPETRKKGDIFYSLIKFEKVDFNNKKYYIVRFHMKGGDTEYSFIDGGSSSLFAIIDNKIEYITGISNYNLKYYFYDLDNDGYTEFFIQSRPTSIIVKTEKGNKNLSPGWGFGGKFPSDLLDSYLEIKEIIPGKNVK